MTRRVSRDRPGSSKPSLTPARGLARQVRRRIAMTEPQLYYDWRKAPDHYCWPEVARPRNLRVSAEDKRTICWLIEQGWWPLDVAVAFGFGIYRTRRGSYQSTVYQDYYAWSGVYGRGGSESRPEIETADPGDKVGRRTIGGTATLSPAWS